MFKFKPIAMILIFTTLVMSMTPAPAEAKKWWKIVGGLLSTAGAVAAGLTGAGAAVVVPLAGLEGALLGVAAGGGGSGGGAVGGISDDQPFYSGPSLPDFCGGATDCTALTALRNANFQPLPLPGTSDAADNLTRTINSIYANPFWADLRNGAPEVDLKADLRLMGAQMDTVVLWYDAVESEISPPLPDGRLMITPQMVAEARDSILANGLPPEEVVMFENAGLTPAEIDSVTAFHVSAMGSIELVVQPLSMHDVLQEAADSFKRMGSAASSVDEPNLQSGISMKQNWPNPFNPSTTIEYNMALDGLLSIDVFNVRGELVKTLLNKEVLAGTGSVVWRGDDNFGNKAPSGVYFYRLRGTGQDIYKKMTLLK